MSRWGPAPRGSCCRGSACLFFYSSFSMMMRGAAPAGLSGDDGVGGAPTPKRPNEARDSTERSLPGGAANVSHDLGGDKLFLAGWVYDVAAIAAHYRTTVDAHCWPVILSTKSDDTILLVCPHHIDLGLPGHSFATLSGFNREHVKTSFSIRATKTQFSTAKWAHVKLGIN